MKMKDVIKKNKGDLVKTMRTNKKGLLDARFNLSNTDKNTSSRKNMRKENARLATALNLLKKKNKMN